MKYLLCPLIVPILFLTSCGKLLNHGPAGSWLLVKEEQAIGVSAREIHPAADSSVRLIFNINGTFASILDHTVISRGTYFISRNNAPSYSDGTLELKGFKPTGIFSLFELYQVSPTGQVLSVYDGMTIKFDGSTMTLTSPITPGGFVSYTFKRA